MSPAKPRVWTDRAGNFFTGESGTIAITRREAGRLLGGAEKLRAALNAHPSPCMKYALGEPEE